MKKKLSRKKAIKDKCLDCSGGMRKEVKECCLIDCPLYPFRVGSLDKDYEKKLREYYKK